MQGENIVALNTHIGLPFGAENIPASQPNTALKSFLSSEWWPAPADGYVVGMGVAFNAVLASGSVSMQFVISSPDSMDAHEALAVAAGDFGGAAQFPVGLYPFSAGDRLGVNYESSGIGVATHELTAVLLVLLTGLKV
jgi:hypothetical protein